MQKEMLEIIGNCSMWPGVPMQFEKMLVYWMPSFCSVDFRLNAVRITKEGQFQVRTVGKNVFENAKPEEVVIVK